MKKKKKMSLNTKLTRNFSYLVLKYKDNIKKTWEVIKESIGKGKCYHQS